MGKSPRRLTLIEIARKAWQQHEGEAREAYNLLLSYGDMPRIPGMDTALRLAVRIHEGKTIEEAAAREYAYRWALVLGQWINHAESHSRSRPITGAWTPPHAIGM